MGKLILGMMAFFGPLVAWAMTIWFTCSLIGWGAFASGGWVVNIIAYPLIVIFFAGCGVGTVIYYLFLIGICLSDDSTPKI